MKEANFQSEFGKRNTYLGVFELKLCKGKSLPFNALKEHQKEALVKVTNCGLYHKISDFPMFSGNKMRFNKPKPFDCFYLKDIPAYVVIMFYVPYKKKTVYYIKIQDWITMGTKANRKSMTEQMANEYMSFVEDYNKKEEWK